MRRTILIGALAVAMMTGAVPASAAVASDAQTATSVQHGWVPAPSAPWDRAAGVVCDFPIHGEAIVDEVQRLTIQTYPDGSPKREAYTGRLVVRVTNTDSGAYYDADASGDAIIDYGTDGSMTWYVNGPVLIGFREARGNLPRGMWVIDGLFTIAFDTTGYKTVTMLKGTTDNVCDRL